MARSDAKRRADNKWNAANMTNLAVKVRRDYAEQVKAKAERQGVTVGSILREALDEFLQQPETDKNE